MTLSIYDKAAEAHLLENAQMSSIIAELNRLFTDGFTIGADKYYVQVQKFVIVLLDYVIML
jgi:hypothetical protein